MEQRKQQVATLVLVVALHVVALQYLLVSERRARPAPVVAERRIELQLIEETTPSPRDDAALRVGRAAPVSALTPSSAVGGAQQIAVVPRASAAVPPQTASVPPHRPRLIDDNGRPRISSGLLEELDAARAAELAGRFHMPEGDTWVLRERRLPIDHQPTRFAEIWLPDGMNPIEEACWRNRGLAFLLSMIGSTDCANPGGPTPRPTPAMIRYGEDSVAEILRKREDWARYNRR
jgi:hypothetical protein